MAKGKEGGKNRKYGRGSRAPTHANQALRTARNKRKNIEREAERLAFPKKLRVPRGEARRRRQHGITRQAV